MSEIHPSAHVDPGAALGGEVFIGPGAFVGPGVELGEGCEVQTRAVVEGPTAVGAGCRIFSGAVIGLEPQVVGFEEQGGRLEIGPGTIIREMATLHRSMKPGGRTRVGAGCYIMAGAHVAHDCLLGDRVVLANYVSLGGHVEIGADSFLSGYVGVHQFVRIGERAFVSAFSPIRKDVPPFTLIEGNPPRVRGLNMVGLRRGEVPPEVRTLLKRAYRLLFAEGGTVAEKCARIEAELPPGREIRSVVEFVRHSGRGICLGTV